METTKANKNNWYDDGETEARDVEVTIGGYVLHTVPFANDVDGILVETKIGMLPCIDYDACSYHKIVVMDPVEVYEERLAMAEKKLREVHEVFDVLPDSHTLKKFLAKSVGQHDEAVSMAKKYLSVRCELEKMLEAYRNGK